MRPDDSTVGTNTSFTPYCLNLIVTSPFCCPTGMGNSPPARKLAGWPLIAVRFGSARMRARFSCTSAEITPSKLPPLQATLNSAPAAQTAVAGAVDREIERRQGADLADGSQAPAS